jgi:hypothetical protein
MKTLLNSLLLVLFIFTGTDLYAQRFTTEQNESYWYKTNVYWPYGGGSKLDTLNYCRVKQNRISSVTTYKFFTETDSQQVSKVEYDTNGIEKRDAHLLSPLAAIDCSERTFVPQSQQRKTTHREDGYKEVWIRDENGYVVEYRKLNRNPLGGLVDLAFGGSSGYRQTFTYSDNYRKVTATRQQKRIMGVFNRWKEPSYVYERVSDEKGNLLSEFLREEMPDGTVYLHWGYTYHYAYYP